MLMWPTFTSILLAIMTQTFGQPTLYQIDDLCLHNNTIRLGTHTIILHINTDFTKYTKCDVIIHLMDKLMKVKSQVIGTVIEKCGIFTYIEIAGGYVSKYDMCESEATLLNQFAVVDRVTMTLDAIPGQWWGVSFNYAIAIYGYYPVCDLPTEECKNTKSDCVDDDCFTGNLDACKFYCNTCNGKRACCDSYGETGENPDSRHTCAVMTTTTTERCIHENMMCDNYTNCVDETDEVCGATTQGLSTLSSGVGVAARGWIMGVVLCEIWKTVCDM